MSGGDGKASARAAADLVRTYCDACAEEIADHLEVILDLAEPAERNGFIATTLRDELTPLVFKSIRLLLADPEGREYVRRIGQKVGSKKAYTRSAEVRGGRSAKAKFQAWAIEEKANVPNVSNNELVRRYRRKFNPAVSDKSLRKYLQGT